MISIAITTLNLMLVFMLSNVWNIIENTWVKYPVGFKNEFTNENRDLIKDKGNNAIMKHNLETNFVNFKHSKI